jgi:hypothetical protein
MEKQYSPSLPEFLIPNEIDQTCWSHILIPRLDENTLKKRTAPRSSTNLGHYSQHISHPSTGLNPYGTWVGNGNWSRSSVTFEFQDHRVSYELRVQRRQLCFPNRDQASHRF